MYQEATARTSAAQQLPYIDHGEQSSPKRLTVIRRDTHSRAGVFLGIISCIALAAVIVIPLLLNTQMAERAFTVRDLQLQINALDAEAWSMQEEISRDASPDVLEKNAKKIGMVPAGPTGFISLSKSSIDGGVPAR